MKEPQQSQIWQENLCADLGHGLSPKCKGVCQQTVIFSLKTLMGLKKFLITCIFKQSITMISGPQM